MSDATADKSDSVPRMVLRHDHGEGDIPDYHEPIWLGDSVLRDRRGRPHRNGQTRWALVRCNNPGCPFEALVNAEIVVRATGPDDYLVSRSGLLEAARDIANDNDYRGPKRARVRHALARLDRWLGTSTNGGRDV